MAWQVGHIMVLNLKPGSNNLSGSGAGQATGADGVWHQDCDRKSPKDQAKTNPLQSAQDQL